MPDLHAKDRAALDRLVADLRDLHGPALLAVALTGEAASAGYIPRKSPLSVVVVLDEVTPEALRRTRGRIPAWRRRRIPAPLLMDPAYVESSLDVFPLEFLEIGDHHVLLHGERNPFADLAIDLSHLRLEVEEQMRGKMLHLWAAYLETGRTGRKRRLKQLLLETPPGFEMILRGLLRLRQGDCGPGKPEQSRPDGPEELLAAVEQQLGVELPVFRRLEAVRHRRAQALSRGELEGVFEGYLAEVRQLVRLTDAL
jgi:hypothetical protein